MKEKEKDVKNAESENERNLNQIVEANEKYYDLKKKFDLQNSEFGDDKRELIKYHSQIKELKK